MEKKVWDADSDRPTSMKDGSRVNQPTWSDIERELFQSGVGRSEQIATLPAYVAPSIGRGHRKLPHPFDIRLPKNYFENLKHKNFKETPPRLRQPAGRGSALRKFIHQDDPTQERTGLATQVQPPRLDKNFLGATSRGLTSEVAAGKACLMEKFLSNEATVTEEDERGVLNPFAPNGQHADGPLISVPNFKNREHWPNMAPRRPTIDYNMADIMKVISCGTSWGRSSSRSSSKRSSKEDGNTAGKGRRGRTKKDAATNSEATSLESGTDVVNQKETVEANGDSMIIPSGDNVLQVECLPADVTEQSLMTVMNRFGPVLKCNVLRESNSQKCVGVAFVSFETSKACQSAIEGLHDKESPFQSLDSAEKRPKLLVSMATS